MPSATSWGLGVIPVATGVVAARFFPWPKDDHHPNPLMPPGYTFALVWTTLYLAIGAAWTFNREQNPDLDIWFSILVGLLLIWLIGVHYYGALHPHATMLMLIIILGYIFALNAQLEPYWQIPLAAMEAWMIFVIVLQSHIKGKTVNDEDNDD